jgi:prevent-host-death family protein
VPPKNLLKSVSATDIKNRFGDYLGEVIHGNQPLLIERHGKPVAVVVKFEEWTRNREEKRRDTPWVDACIQLSREIEKERPRSKSFSAVELIRRIREEE